MKQVAATTAFGGTPEEIQPLRIPTPALRGNPDADPVRHIFVALGGGGSTALGGALMKYARTVGVRPDLNFPPAWFPRLLTSEVQVLDGEQMARTQPEQKILKAWEISSGYPLDTSLTVDRNLEEWIRWLETTSSAAVVWLLAAQGFFSRVGIRGVVFIIRHPLRGYASFVHHERHGDLVHPWGGPDSEQAVRLYARWWNGTASEAVRLRQLGLNPLILKYESLWEDLEVGDADLRAALGGWEPARRGGALIQEATESLLRGLTGDLVKELLGPWGLRESISEGSPTAPR